MVEEWIVLVHGKEYGPVDVETLREWKQEDRVLPANQARRAGTTEWIQAREIPGLFGNAAVAQATQEIAAAPRPQPRRFIAILGQTFRIYGRGFFQFLGLTLLVVVPANCAQLVSAALETSRNLDLDLRSLLAGGFGLCMLALTCAAWPIYIAGIQILTAELRRGRRRGFLFVLNEAVKYWLRVASLCILVYVAFSFLILLAVGIVVLLAIGAASLGLIAVALVLLFFQVWMFGRLFINVLFWQQFAVLAGEDVFNSLRLSKYLARSGKSLPWYQRPLWRGAALASLWMLFVLLINLPIVWPIFETYWRAASTSQDPQAIMQAMMANQKIQGTNVLSAIIGLIQALFRPLVGISFVLLYFDARSSAVED